MSTEFGEHHDLNCSGKYCKSCYELELHEALYLIGDAQLLLENLPPINGYLNWKENVKILLKRIQEWKEKK